jgi:peptidoglycan/xylan/chitin deacetylase (PgdA/CDA1 family)
MEAGAILRRMMARMASRIPFGLQRRLAPTPVLLPYYHMVSDVPVPHFDHVFPHYPNVRQFEAHIDLFLRRCVPVDLKSIVDHLDGVRPLPDRAFHLSFDDGYREMHDVVMPILRRKGVTATFFLNTVSLDNRKFMFYNKMSAAMDRLRPGDPLRAQIARLAFGDDASLDTLCREAGLDDADYLARAAPYLSDVQVRTMMSPGFTIGSHSIDHAPFAALPLEQQLRETLDCQAELNRRFAPDHAAFAFPGGDGGVSKEFFRALEGKIAVTFAGSHGFAEDEPRHLQRMSFETTDMSDARTILADRLATAMLRRALGRDKRHRFASERERQAATP